MSELESIGFDIGEARSCFFKVPEIVDFHLPHQSNQTYVWFSANASQLFLHCREINDALDALSVYGNIALCIVITLGLILNFFILSVLILDSTKTSTDYYLISIAIGDTAICVGTVVSSQLTRYYSGYLVASVGNIIGNLGMFACLSTVMALTIERYCAVKDPMSSLYTCSRERSAKIVLLTWTTLIIYCIVAEVLTYQIPVPDEGPQIHEGRVYVLFYINFTLFYIIPVCVSLILYMIILKIIRTREQNLGDLVCPAGNPGASNQNASKKMSAPTTKISTCSLPIAAQFSVRSTGSQRADTSATRVSDERIRRLLSLKTMMRMFLLVLVSFVLLMSPYRWIMFVWSVKQRAFPDSRITGWFHFYHKLLVAIFSILYASNSIVDPILYNILAKRFRLKVRNLLSKVRAKIQRPRRLELDRAGGQLMPRNKKDSNAQNNSKQPLEANASV